MHSKTPLMQAYGRFRAILLTTFVFSFFINLLMFVGPLYMLQIYDRVMSSRNEVTLLMLTGLAVGLLITYGLLEFIRSKLLIRAGLQFDDVVASPVFNRVVRQASLLPNANAHVAISDIDKLREFMTGHGILAFFDAPWVPLFLTICYLFHPYLGLVATAGAVIIFSLALVNEFSTRKALQMAGQAGQGANHFIATTMHNAEVIRSLGMERALTKRWMSHHDKMLDEQAKASGRAGMILASSKFVRMSLQVAILGTGAFLALEQIVSPGIMIAASIMMGRALAPVEQAVGHWKQFVAARQSHKRLVQLFQAMGDEPERIEQPEPNGALRVEQVFSTVPGTRQTILKNINFALAPGEVLALIGPSGSGKSTLVRHLVGAVPPSPGAVRLDGTELQHWQSEQLGRNLGYLPQDVKLFRGTVAENISRFAEDAKDTEIVAAAQLSGAHDMIQTLSQGYETDVGDDGRSLSGGQRQRIGLARAVFGTPKLIVLDEPNSNLDSIGETALFECIQELKRRGTTIILVTHKANLLSLTDKTLMLLNGAVERFGPTKDFFSAPAAAKTDGQAAPARRVPTVVNMAHPG